MRWSRFRESLRRRDRLSFDNMFQYSKRHFSAIGNSELVDGFEAVMLAILLEYGKRIEKLEEDAGHNVGRPPRQRWDQALGER